jgi:azurin
MYKLFMLAAFSGMVALTSCGNDNEKKSETKTTETAKEQTTDKGSTAISNTVELSAGDDMKYDKIEIRVKANEKVTLTLKNIGKQPIQQMGHNFVLLKDDVKLADFALKANQSQPDYIPKDMGASIIAHTKLLGPGESDTIEFTVPAGSYTYICSFPGHYMTMTGILTAE